MSKTLFTLVIISSCVGLFSASLEYLGILLRQRLERARRAKLLDQADRTLGSVVGGVTVVAAIWIIAAIFTNVPIQGIQNQLRNSVIITQLNKSLPDAPTAVTKLGHLIDPNNFPNVFTGLEPKIDTSAALPSLGDLDTAVQMDRTSVVKITGPGCGGISEGSGFVAGQGLVITNAHVVAGVKSVSILDGTGRHSANVLWFDPNLDIAVLRASGLDDTPLAMVDAVATNSTPAAVLGYPGGGDFAAKPATILESFNAQGRNIYNQGQTERQVYSVKADIQPGNSGGPLVDKDGKVIGVIFAKSTTYDQVGYALTMHQVIDAFNQAKGRSQTVSTGSCTE